MTKNSAAIDTARVELLLTELRLPAIKQMWPKLAEQADQELNCWSIWLHVTDAPSRPTNMRMTLSTDRPFW